MIAAASGLSDRNFTVSASDITGASGIGGGNYYAGPELGELTPTIYAGVTALGTGTGASEANCTTLTAALASATAGAIIGVLPGVYTKAHGAGRFNPAWTTTNSGTSGNPIIVVAKYSAIDLGGATYNGLWTQTMVDNVFANANRSEFRHDGTRSTGATGSPAFGVSSKNYVYFIGFCADENNAAPTPDSGPAVIIGATGSRIYRSVLQGRSVVSGWASDNHPGIRLESATDPYAWDNVVTGFRYYDTLQNGGHNHCGIQRYECTGTNVQHNFCFFNNTNIYLKDQDIAANETVKFNYCYNPEASGSQIEILNTNESGGTDTICSQNLCLNTINDAPGLIGQDQGRNIKWRNNTVIGDFTGGGSAAIVAHYQDIGGEINDNIFYCRGGSTFIDQQFRSVAIVPSNYNRFYSAAGFSSRYNSSTHASLSAWRTATSQDNNSATGDPSFVNYAGKDFKLATGSPCLTGSSSGGPQGCYITGLEIMGPRYASNWADVFVAHDDAGPEFDTDGQIVGVRGTTLAHYGERITAGNGASNVLIPGGSWDGVENAVQLFPPDTVMGGSGNAEYAGIFHGTDLDNGGTKAVNQANFGVCLFFGPRAYDLNGSKFTGFQMVPTVGGSPNNRSAIFSGYYATDDVYVMGITAATVQAYDNPPTGYSADTATAANRLCHIKTTAAQNHAASPPVLGQEWFYLEQMVAPEQNGTNANGRAEVRIWTRDGVVSGRSLVIPLNWDGGWSFANNRYVSFFEYLNGYFNIAMTPHADNWIKASHGRFAVNKTLNSFMGPPPGFLL